MLAGEGNEGLAAGEGEGGGRGVVEGGDEVDEVAVGFAVGGEEVGFVDLLRVSTSVRTMGGGQPTFVFPYTASLPSHSSSTLLIPSPKAPTSTPRPSSLTPLTTPPNPASLIIPPTKKYPGSTTHTPRVTPTSVKLCRIHATACDAPPVMQISSGVTGLPYD